MTPAQLEDIADQLSEGLIAEIVSAPTAHVINIMKLAAVRRPTQQLVKNQWGQGGTRRQKTNTAHTIANACTDMALTRLPTGWRWAPTLQNWIAHVPAPDAVARIMRRNGDDADGGALQHGGGEEQQPQAEEGGDGAAGARNG